MVILSLDTTSRSGSSAVVRDGVVLARRAGPADVTHGQRLPLELESLLAEAGLRIADVDSFAVAIGPGSFTGLRVGIATIQGLAVAHGRRVIPVSTLEALAHAAPARPGPIAVWMDAQRGEVFAQLFAREPVAAMADAQALPPQQVLDAWQDVDGLAGAVFIGDGAVRYADRIRSAFGDGAKIQDPPPLAHVIARIAASAPGRAVLPHALVPLYVRRPDAELARARRERAADTQSRQ